MPRSYGRFTTSIWRDPDFTSLTLAQQGLYFTLGLQPDVTAAGTLPFTARRWAKLSSGVTRDDIEQLVSDLATHQGAHLVIDDDTEELMIRKFIKWDGGWANSKRLPVVVDAVSGIASEQIRHTALDELVRIATSDMASVEQRDAISRALSPFDRVVVTEGGNESNPHSSTPEGEPPGPTPDALVAAGSEPPAMFCPKHPNGTDKACGPCGVARMRFAAWQKQRERDEVEARRLAAHKQTHGVLADLADARAKAVPRPKDAS